MSISGRKEECSVRSSYGNEKKNLLGGHTTAAKALQIAMGGGKVGAD